MSRLAHGSVSSSALATVVLGTIVVLLLPSLSAGASEAAGDPRLSIVIQGVGPYHANYRELWVGDRTAVCLPGRRVDVTATVGGIAHTTLTRTRAGGMYGKAFCNRNPLAEVHAIDPGDGSFGSDGPDAGRQFSGPPECAAKWGGGTDFSVWMVVCRFF